MPRQKIIPTPNGCISRTLTISIAPEAWDSLEQRALHERRELAAEIAVQLERAMAAAGPLPSAPSPNVVTIYAGITDEERGELQRLERRGFALRKPNGGFQGVYAYGKKWKSGVNLGARGKYLWLGSFDTQEAAALARARYLRDKSRQDRQALLEKERLQGLFLREDVHNHPGYQAWLMDQVDEFTPKVPCPFQYGVDYDVDPVTLEVRRVDDDVVVIPAGKYLASGELIQLGGEL